MKKIYTLITLLCLTAGMSAQPSSKEIPTLPVVDKIGGISVLSADGEGTAFVVKDGKTTRILGRTDTPYRRGMELPGGLRLWLSAANEALAEQSDAPKAFGNVAPESVEPFITTKWNQESPYFNKCPQVSLKRTVTGCTATSLAQILKYYEYPAKSEGSFVYYISKVVAGQESVSEKTATLNTVYDYANMLDNYNGSYTTKQADAVANLMRDCGYASGMRYGREASSAYYHEAAVGLTQNFGYNERSLQYFLREFFSEEEWLDMIYTELIERRPIMYSGSDTINGGAHSFVFDGLLPDGMVHINWGWGGSMDGFYDINVMSKNANYTVHQDMIFGIKPFKATADTPYEYVPFIALDDPQIAATDTSLVFTGGVYNYDFRTMKGTAGLVFVNEEKQDSISLLFLEEEYEDENGNIQTDSLPGWMGWRFKSGANNKELELSKYFTPEEIPAGNYKVFFGYRASFEDEDVLHTSRTDGGEWFATFTVSEDRKYTVTNPSGIETGLPAIRQLSSETSNALPSVNVFGQPVGKDYRGIVIEQGKKVLRR